MVRQTALDSRHGSGLGRADHQQVDRGLPKRCGPHRSLTTRVLEPFTLLPPAQHRRCVASPLVSPYSVHILHLQLCSVAPSSSLLRVRACRSFLPGSHCPSASLFSTSSSIATIGTFATIARQKRALPFSYICRARRVLVTRSRNIARIVLLKHARSTSPSCALRSSIIPNTDALGRP